VYDLAEPSRQLAVGDRPWRATLQLLYRDGVFMKEQAVRLGWRLGGAGTSIPVGECRRAAEFLRDAVLSGLAVGDCVRVDDGLGAFDEVTDGTMTLDDFRALLSRGEGEAKGNSTLLTRQWLQELADFLLQCDGAGAIEEGFAIDSLSRRARVGEPRGRPTRS
jgi:hypothetical protein